MSGKFEGIAIKLKIVIVASAREANGRFVSAFQGGSKMADGRDSKSSGSRDSPRKTSNPSNVSSPIRNLRTNSEERMSPTMERLMERMNILTLKTPLKRGDESPKRESPRLYVHQVIEETDENPNSLESYTKRMEDDFGITLPKLYSPGRRAGKGRKVNDETLVKTLDREHHRRLTKLDDQEDSEEAMSRVLQLKKTHSLQSQSSSDSSSKAEQTFNTEVDEDLEVGIKRQNTGDLKNSAERTHVMNEILPELEKSLECIQLYAEENEDELDAESVLERSLHEVSEVFYILTLSNKARALAEKARNVPGSDKKPFYKREKNADIGTSVLINTIEERVGDLLTPIQKKIITNRYTQKLRQDPLGKSLPKVGFFNEFPGVSNPLKETDSEKHKKQEEQKKEGPPSPSGSCDSPKSNDGSEASLRMRDSLISDDYIESCTILSPNDSMRVCYDEDEFISQRTGSTCDDKSNDSSKERINYSALIGEQSEQSSDSPRRMHTRTRSEINVHRDAGHSPLKTFNKSISLPEKMSNLISFTEETIAAKPAKKKSPPLSPEPESSDNDGVVIESVFRPHESTARKRCSTIDLTSRDLEEDAKLADVSRSEDTTNKSEPCKHTSEPDTTIPATMSSTGSDEGTEDRSVPPNSLHADDQSSKAEEKSETRTKVGEVVVGKLVSIGSWGSEESPKKDRVDSQPAVEKSIEQNVYDDLQPSTSKTGLDSPVASTPTKPGKETTVGILKREKKGGSEGHCYTPDPCKRIDDDEVFIEPKSDDLESPRHTARFDSSSYSMQQRVIKDSPLAKVPHKDAKPLKSILKSPKSKTIPTDSPQSKEAPASFNAKFTTSPRPQGQGRPKGKNYRIAIIEKSPENVIPKIATQQ